MDVNKVWKTMAGGGLGAALVLVASAGVAASQELGGYTWETLGTVTDRPGTEVGGIAQLPDGRIAMVGHECPTDRPCDPGSAPALAWTSDDGGASWTETELDLPRLGGGLLTMGDTFVTATSDTVLTSPDGMSWSVLADIGNADVAQLLRTTDGLAAVGVELRPAEGGGDQLAEYPTLWLSDDGVEWEAHEVSSPPFGPDDDASFGVDSAARSDDGSWFVTGNGIEFDPEGAFREFPLAWHGSPEEGWTEVSLPEGARYPIPWGTSTGFLVRLELEDLSTGLWQTGDGSDWTQVVDTDGLNPVRFGLRYDDGFIGFKEAYELPDGYQTQDAIELDGSPAYISPDGETWTDGELLLGVNVAAIAATDDGSVLVAGGPAPCTEDPPDCNYFWGSENERPIVLRGTPN